jgi:four helix bundle protein
MSKPYDIRERARLFADDVVAFCLKLGQKSERHVKLIDQLNDAAGSIGANLEEAKDGQSKKDFIHKNNLALKEAREARHWLRLAAARERSLQADARPLIQEASEIVAIITTVIKRGKSNPNRGRQNAEP